MLSASVFLNGALVLEDQWLMNSRVPSVIVAVLNTAAAPMLVWTGWDICLRRRYLNADKLLEREKQVAESARIPGAKTPILRAGHYKLNLRRADYLIMAVVTLVYFPCWRSPIWAA